MANITPFKGWRYNQRRISNINNVLVPPYDVISPEEQDHYYHISHYNSVRLNLNREEGQASYIDAAKNLDQWKSEGILIQDEKDSIYIISQEFEYKNKNIQRIGCICALKLTDLGKIVLPHEETIEKYINDRYNLLEATLSNTGQIFMCYKDETMGLEAIFEELRDFPIIDAIIDKVHYKVWQVSDPTQINRFKNVISGKNVVIKDGHHRYKTALRFSQKHPEITGADKVMVTLVNSKDPGMIVLPTHRLLKGINMDIETIISRLGEYFEIEKMNGPDRVVSVLENGSKPKGVFGVYHKESETGLLLHFTHWKELNIMFSNQSKTSRELDTNILHKFVLKHVFKIDTSKQEDLKHMAYIRGNKSTLSLIQMELNYDVACFVKPPTLEEIFSIAEAGEIMPQKSTFFFPKIYSGLVLRCLGE
ncbi:MAG: DUF1015 domain-containing protein [Fidelibacterota bacterium]